jgi:hypothetical protein
MTFFENLIPSLRNPPFFVLAKLLSQGGARTERPCKHHMQAYQNTRKNPPGTGDFQTMKNSPCQATSMICNV